MKKNFLGLILILAILILTACGGKGKAASSDSENAEIKQFSTYKALQYNFSF